MILQAVTRWNQFLKYHYAFKMLMFADPLYRYDVGVLFLSISFTVRNQFLWREDSWITLNFYIMLNSIYYLELDIFITLKKN